MKEGMSDRKSLIMGIFIVVFSVFINLNGAEFVKRGQVGFRFLENPVSAEAIGRGCLGLVSIYNGNSVFWNPAGISWMKSLYDFSANYNSWIVDISYTSLVASVSLRKWGVVAFDVLGMDYGEFYGTRRANNERGFEDTGVFSPEAYCIGFTYSQKVSNRFSYGVRVKYAYQDLGTAYIGLQGTDVDDSLLVIGRKSYSHGEPAVDVGAVYDFNAYGFRFGAVMRNFSREVRYERQRFPLPFSVSFSVVFNPGLFFSQGEFAESLCFGFETIHPRDFGEKVKFGLEYHYRGVLILRTGYMYNYDERGLTFGFGVRKGFGDVNLRVDYAYQDFGVFGGVSAMSFGIGF